MSKMVLSVKDLCKTYPSFYLDHVSFDVEEGTIMGLIGRNGAGKSTTLKSILGMVKPDEGARSVEILGLRYPENEQEVKEQIGVVIGDSMFYPKKKVSTLTDVVRRFYKNWDEEKYQHYLKLFEIKDNKKIDELSSGMKVKYLIALALSHDAKLLILDESTSGLDPVSRDDLCRLLKALADSGHCSILFSTHITSDLEKCASHITFIQNGRIRFTGTREGFMEHFSDLGSTLEDIIVQAERGESYEDAII